MTQPLMPLPIAPRDALRNIILPALGAHLPLAMSATEALLMVLTIMLQESRLAHRWQVVDLARPLVMGPARGLAQFEKGTRASRGGVWGVYLHDASRYWLAKVCEQRGVDFTADAIWRTLHMDDQLSACLARLLLFTDPKRLPAIGDEEAAWQCYLRNWRPGAAKRQYAELRRKWGQNYAHATDALRQEVLR